MSQSTLPLETLADMIVERYRQSIGDGDEAKSYCVEVLRRDRDTWNIVRARLRELARPIVYLDGVDLRGVDAHQCDLCEAYLLGANLERANLDEANLERATCVDARLRHASIRWAQLSEANFYDADLTGAALHKNTCRGTIFPNNMRT